MTTAAEHAQKLSTETLITLFELDLTPLGGTVLRWTTSSIPGGNVSYGGNVYTPLDLHADGFEWTGQGPLPRPKIKITNAENLVRALVISFGDLRGAELTRTRTWRRFLDDGVEPDGTAWLSQELFIIDRKVQDSKIMVEFELTSVLDQEGRKLPGRQILKEYCSHRYRVWDPVGMAFDYTNATCPYTGTDLFNSQGQVETDEEHDYCGKKLSDCRLRFGQNGVLPTRAFPGVTRLRIVQ